MPAEPAEPSEEPQRDAARLPSGTLRAPGSDVQRATNGTDLPAETSGTAKPDPAATLDLQVQRRNPTPLDGSRGTDTWHPITRDHLDSSASSTAHTNRAGTVQSAADADLPATDTAHLAATTYGDPLPDLVGHYELLGELGRGTMGVVYRARQQGLGRLVALKMMLGGEHATPAERERFRTEAESAARLDHPGIVPIYEIGMHDGRPFFSMGYVEGQNLAAATQAGPFAPPEAARIAQAIAEAIDHAHHAGILHRDLKPQNVLLDRSQMPRITDFGLAKKLEADSHLTATGQILGTPSYMPPEQAQGQVHALTPAADTYAVGAILYHLLTGRPPFSAANVFETLLQVIEEEPVPPRRLNPRIPAELETICLKCLEKNPARRYHSACALAADLQRWRQGEPILAKPLGFVARCTRWCRRHPTIAALWTTLALVVCASLAVLSFMLFDTWQSRNAAEIARRAAEKLLLSEREAREQAERSQSEAVAARKQAETAQQAAFELFRSERQARDEALRSKATAEQQRVLAEQRAAEIMIRTSLESCQEGEITVGLWFLAAAVDDVAAAFDSPLRNNLTAWSQRLLPLSAIIPHPERLAAHAWSNDGTQFLTATGNGQVRLWSLPGGKPNGPGFQHREGVTCADFSRNDQWLATASLDDTVQVWQTATGKLLRPPLQHRDDAMCVAIAPDQQTIATASWDKTARIWPVEVKPGASPEATFVLNHPAEVLTVVYNPTGTLLATTCRDRNVRLWDTSTGQLHGVVLEHRQNVRVMRFHPTADQLFTGDNSGSWKVWDTTTGKPLATVAAHQGGVTDLRLSNNGKQLFTVGEDHLVKLWQADTRRPIDSNLVWPADQYTASFLADNESLAVVTHTSQVLRWSREDARPVEQSQQPASLTDRNWHPLSISPNGCLLATTTSLDDPLPEVRIWQLPLGPLPARQLRPASVVRLLEVSDSGQMLLSADGLGRVTLWHAHDGTYRTELLPHPQQVDRLALHDASQLAITCDVKNEVRFWSLVNRKVMAGPVSLPSGIVGLAVTARGDRVAVACADQCVRILNRQGEVQDTSPAFPASIQALTWKNDEIVIAYGDGPVTLQHGWDISAKQFNLPLVRLLLPPVFSADGSRVATAAAGSIARVWDTETGEPVSPVCALQARPTAIDLTTKGQWLATANSEGTARLWHVGTGLRIGPPLQLRSPMQAIAFADQAKQWVVSTGEPLPLDRDAALWFHPLPEPLLGNKTELQRWIQQLTGYQGTGAAGLQPLSPTAWQDLKR